MAAKALLNQFKNAAVVGGDVYVLINPFNIDVNVGSDEKGSSWLRGDL